MWLRGKDGSYPAGTPYYAGKGSGKRAVKHHEAGLKPPRDKSLILVMPRSNEAEAFKTEMELIANWGRKDLGTGCLLNRTDGGEGGSGAVRSDETRAKNGIANKGRKHSLKTKLKVSTSLLGNKRRAGIPHTEDTKAKVSVSMKGRPKSPETRAKMSAWQIGRKRPTFSDEWKANLSLGKKLWWAKRKKATDG